MTNEIDHIWEYKVKNETKKAFACFNVYLGMGYYRSIKKVSKETGVSVSQLERYSSKYGWVNRCNAKKEHDSIIRCKKREGELNKFYEEKLIESEEYQNVVDIVLKSIEDELKSPDCNIFQISKALLNIGLAKTNMANLQFRLFGEPEKITQTNFNATINKKFKANVKTEHEIKMYPTDEELYKFVNDILEKGSNKLDRDKLEHLNYINNDKKRGDLDKK